jgi:hypothetical protein
LFTGGDAAMGPPVVGLAVAGEDTLGERVVVEGKVSDGVPR